MSYILLLWNPGNAACCAHSCRKPEPQPKWVVTQQRQHPKVFPTQGLRCQTNSSFLGFQQWDTLHWSDLWQGWKQWREWFSHSGQCLTAALAPFTRYWCPFLQYILGIDVIWIVSQMFRQDIELEQVFVLPAMWLGAGLLDECDEPSVGENNLVFGK